MNYPANKLYFPKFGWNGLLIVGDVPYDEKSQAAPFMQSHLGSLQILLKKSDILGLNGECAIANICSQFPYKGLMNNLDDSIIKNELDQFKELINELKPRFLLVLGRQTARYLFGTSDLEEERGAPFYSYNSIPTIMSFHPKEIFRQYEMNIVAQSDFAKMRRIMVSGWEPAKWNINYQPTFQEVMQMLYKFLEAKAALSVDIETGSDLRMTCVGLSYNTTSALVIPFRIPGGRYWTEVEERAIWRLLARVLETCPLLGQNSVHFDHFVLCIMHKIMPNFVSDTMLAHHEVYCEMPKSLGFINSLYLMNPYWKDVLKEARTGKRPYIDEFEYCGKDTIGTLQGAIEIKKEFVEMPPKAFEHYKFNIRVSRAFQYMGMNGVLFDTAKCNARVKELDDEAKQRELELRVLAGKPTLNVKSPKQMIEWLYEDLKLPPKYKEKKLESGDTEMRETSDYLTLLRLAHEFPDRKELMLAAKLRKVYKRLSTLSTIRVRPDGRVGYAFNIVGTVTGRASAKKPLDKFGIQPQNQDRRDRDLFLGDDQWLKADLEGADAWTVAAMLEAMGDSTMMIDLKTGVKPAQILAIAQCFGSHLITLPASELLAYKPQLKEVIKREELSRGPGKTIYDICKAESHGCVTAGHEVLTRDGWVKIEELKEGEEILTWTEKLEAVWDIPSKLTSFNFTGDLYSFKGVAYDLEVTNDHRMPYITNDNLKVILADNLAYRKAAKLPVSALTYKGVSFKEDFIRLAAAYQADGSERSKTQASFHFMKSRKFARLCELCQRIGVEYTYYNNKDGTVQVIVTSPNLIDFGKKSTYKMLLLSGENMRTYLEESLLWDGNVQESFNHKRQEILTAEKERAEVLNTMARMCGFGSQLSLDKQISGFGTSMHSISLNCRTMANLNTMEIKSHWTASTPVYCVTVKTGFFFIRRNSKVMITGNSNYGMGPQTGVDNIFKRSEGELYITPAQFKTAQLLYEKRYSKLIKLQEKMVSLLNSHGYLDAFSGNRRYFFGRRDNNTVREMLSQLPQACTTYATNLLLERLYYWKGNRQNPTSRKFIAGPANQVHDETDVMFKLSDLDRVKEVLDKCTKNEIFTWGVKYSIPFEMKYGANWGDCDTEL